MFRAGTASEFAFIRERTPSKRKGASDGHPEVFVLSGTMCVDEFGLTLYREPERVL
jgi:hypothetical protein